MDYNPNIAYNMADQRVSITFGRYEYRLTVETLVGGNCSGFTVIESAIENIYEELEVTDYDEELKMTLYDDKGNSLEVIDEKFENIEWLKSLVISATIISIEESKDYI